MKYRTRTYYTDSQKALMWDRWKQGWTLHQIAQLFNRVHTSVHGILARNGGIRPPRRSIRSCRSTRGHWSASDGSRTTSRQRLELAVPTQNGRSRWGAHFPCGCFPRAQRLRRPGQQATLVRLLGSGRRIGVVIHAEHAHIDAARVEVAPERSSSHAGTGEKWNARKLPRT